MIYIIYLLILVRFGQFLFKFLSYFYLQDLINKCFFLILKAFIIDFLTFF